MEIQFSFFCFGSVFHPFSSRRYGNVNGSLTRYMDYAFRGERGDRGSAMPIHFAAALCVQCKIVKSDLEESRLCEII